MTLKPFKSLVEWFTFCGFWLTARKRRWVVVSCLLLALFLIVVGVSKLAGSPKPKPRAPVEPTSMLTINSVCELPDLPRNPQSWMRSFKTPCASPFHRPLTVVTRRPSSWRHVLGLLQFAPKELKCCYSTVNGRSVSAKGDGVTPYTISEATCFERNVTIGLEDEAILVNCSTPHDIHQKLRRAVQLEMHFVVQDKATARRKMTASAPDARLNVLLVLLDGVSRIGSRRLLPRTLDKMEAEDDGAWVQLRGFHTVSESAVQNGVAVLTGLDVIDQEDCWVRQNGAVSQICPFIWKEFGERGYVTALAHDLQDDTSFPDQPADFYFRPFLLAAKDLVSPWQGRNFVTCIGSKTVGEHALNLVADVARTFHDHAYLGVVWMNGKPKVADLELVAFLQRLEDDRTLESTVVVVASTHGVREGANRATKGGWYEERLPFAAVRTPQWFRDRYTAAWSNLKASRYRVTSPYDLYWTLRDILEFPTWDRHRHVTTSSSSSRSLFSKIPYERTCQQAGIAEEWCACNRCDDLPLELAEVKEAARLLVEYVELQAAAYFAQGTCVRPMLRYVHRACRFSDPEQFRLLVTVRTEPGARLYEASFVVDWSMSQVGRPGMRFVSSVVRVDGVSSTDCLRENVFCHCNGQS